MNKWCRQLSKVGCVDNDCMPLVDNECNKKDTREDSCGILHISHRHAYISNVDEDILHSYVMHRPTVARAG
jgi:hypothetical protein